MDACRFPIPGFEFIRAKSIRREGSIELERTTPWRPFVGERVGDKDRTGFLGDAWGERLLDPFSEDISLRMGERARRYLDSFPPANVTLVLFW